MRNATPRAQVTTVVDHLVPLSRERIRQIEIQALTKLRNPATRSALRDLLPD